MCFLSPRNFTSLILAWSIHLSLIQVVFHLQTHTRVQISGKSSTALECCSSFSWQVVAHFWYLLIMFHQKHRIYMTATSSRHQDIMWRRSFSGGSGTASLTSPGSFNATCMLDSCCECCSWQHCNTQNHQKPPKQVWQSGRDLKKTHPPKLPESIVIQKHLCCPCF